MNTAIIDKKKYVLVPEEEYKRLVQGVPAMPPADADGNFPALAAMEASIARNIVRDREAVGLSQKELALSAGIRVEVFNRAECGVVVPSIRTLSKIEQRLTKAGLEAIDG